MAIEVCMVSIAVSERDQLAPSAKEIDDRSSTAAKTKQGTTSGDDCHPRAQIGLQYFSARCVSDVYCQREALKMLYLRVFAVTKGRRASNYLFMV